jgi:hypothetical protein
MDNKRGFHKLVQGKDSFETEGGVGRKNKRRTAVELSTAVCMEEKVERVSLPVRNIQRLHTVLIWRPLLGIGVGLLHITLSGVAVMSWKQEIGASMSMVVCEGTHKF